MDQTAEREMSERGRGQQQSASAVTGERRRSSRQSAPAAADDASTTRKGDEASGDRHEAIARRAYQIYCDQGCQNGRDVEHWLQAESELRQR